jgi:hypothetical protein
VTVETAGTARGVSRTGTRVRCGVGKGNPTGGALAPKRERGKERGRRRVGPGASWARPKGEERNWKKERRKIKCFLI